MNFTGSDSQTSELIDLVAGESYYIEALHKEGQSYDYAAVAWEGPNFTRQVISGDFLEYPGATPAMTQPTSPVMATGIDPSDAFWLEFSGPTDNNRAPVADPDQDGLPNSMEFALGGNPTNRELNATDLLPQMSIDGDWAVFEFRRAEVSSVVDPFAAYSASLSSWTRLLAAQTEFKSSQ